MTEIPEIPEVETASVEIELDEPSTVKFARLVEATDEEFVTQLLTGNATDHIEQLWKQRNEIEDQYSQREKARQVQMDGMEGEIE